MSSSMAMLTRVAALPPPRPGRRPTMHRSLPHIQLDQLPASETIDALIGRGLSIPGVQWRQSRMASPESHALWIPDFLALGPAEAFIDGHEFCHLHPSPEGSIHLTLPAILRDEVIRLGWGEPHPIAAAGILPSLITIYAPRTVEEIDTVFDLVLQSFQFARGDLRILQRDHAVSGAGW